MVHLEEIKDESIFKNVRNLLKPMKNRKKYGKKWNIFFLNNKKMSSYIF